mmetsp:Transcript_71461/g.213214  ORF Transcript_71461/g.213214 Transcript_71461/m.213214 type:complete len:99 (+) Transcript_71461:193-489(+)
MEGRRDGCRDDCREPIGVTEGSEDGCEGTSCTGQEPSVGICIDGFRECGTLGLKDRRECCEAGAEVWRDVGGDAAWEGNREGETNDEGCAAEPWREPN